jgi:hypothetical protein
LDKNVLKLPEYYYGLDTTLIANHYSTHPFLKLVGAKQKPWWWEHWVVTTRKLLTLTGKGHKRRMLKHPCCS